MVAAAMSSGGAMRACAGACESTERRHNVSPICRRSPLVRTLIAALVPIGLAACSTQPGDIFRTLNLTNDNSALIGARQRIILNSPVGEGSRPGLVNPERVVCAEPSPDVALAVAQSLGVGLSVFGGGNQGALSGTGATAEGVAQLGERTQAIQLLRDQMYRACEAYANGAITGTTYNLIMSKNNDAMVTLMMAGVAGGEFGRAGAAIGGASSSESKATVSSLLEVLEAADQAAEELTEAEEEKAAAEDNLEAKETIAADQEGKTEEEIAEEEEELEKAEDQAAAAEEKLREKQDVKNAADSKARAEITKVIGAGSIAANVSVGTAQVLERMQDNFLREDFADEYVSACIVELGLANAGAPEYLRDLAYAEAVTRAHINDKFVDQNPEEQASRAAEYVAFLQTIGTTERYSLLARHCQERLFEFVVFARTGETALEQEKIRLDAQRIALEGDTTRNEALTLYKQILDGCGKIGDPVVRNKCLQSATTIVERPGGIFELGAITTVEVPTGKPPLPVVAFDLATAHKTAFDEQKQKLATAVVPTVDPTKMGAEDAANLAVTFAELTKANGELKVEADKLSSEAGPMLDPSKRVPLVNRQNERPGLLTEVELSVNKSDEDKAIAQDRLKLHDRESTKAVNEYRDLGERLERTTRSTKAHLAAIDDLRKAIEAAIKKKAGG